MKQNRLAGARSPYLRQHATNPVDWQPWGEEAFARAREEDRPVFLSVGYAACHWCHVMEHESFEDEETARLLNEVFVCVKVDREERPDVDALYMQAVHLTAGRGGWPMTVLLTPEGEPFWAGTYLPPAHVQELARKVQALWAQDASRLRQQAALVAGRMRDLARGYDALPPFDGSDADLLRMLDAALEADFDARRGGYGSRPKFPPHAELLFLLDRAGAPDGEARLAQARRTLEAMADGGIHDHVGGGFHRYSTDGEWLLPHFEKMLYDNALLAVAYARMHAALGEGPEGRFADVARDVLGWVRREMALPGGGYASSLDADTQGEEGLTYTWTEEEIRGALPSRDADLAVKAWGVQERGNFRDEATGRVTGRNVLHFPRPLQALAGETGLERSLLRARLEEVGGKLRAARDRRAQPALDDKAITAWNGLLLSAFAQVGRHLGDAKALEDGRALAAWLLDRCRRPADGMLLRFPRGSGPEIPGFAEDHVHLIEGLLDLEEATGEARWGDAAQGLADALLDGFEDRERGGFFATAEGRHETLLARQKETFDSPIPSDNGTAARALLRLARREGGAERFAAAARRTLDAWRPLLANARSARGTVALYRALALAAAGAAGEAAPGDAAPGDAAPGDATAQAEGIRADLFLERDEVRLGARVRFAVRVTVPEGLHVNAANTEAPDRIPTVLALAEGAPATLVHLDPPPAVSRAFGEGTAPLEVLEGTFWIRGALEVPAGVPPGPRRVPFRLRLQPCSDTACLQEQRLELVAAIRYAEADGPARHPAHFER